LQISLVIKALVPASTLFLAATLAVAQNSNQDSTQKPDQSVAEQDSLKHYVWTNDNIVSLRTPADLYQLEKEAREAAEALAQQRAIAERTSQPPLGVKLPATLEETEQAIKDSQDDIQDQKETIARLRKELDESPEEQRAEKTKEIDRRTAVLEASEKELKAFEDRRNELVKAAPVGAGTAVATKDVASASAGTSCKESGPACPN
jgi:chromosome segregation ATPase